MTSLTPKKIRKYRPGTHVTEDEDGLEQIEEPTISPTQLESELTDTINIPPPVTPRFVLRRRWTEAELLLGSRYHRNSSDSSGSSRLSSASTLNVSEEGENANEEAEEEARD